MAGSSQDDCSDGIGGNARFRYRSGLVCTSDGSKVVVADYGNHRLRLIHTATNEVVTIAGRGKGGHSDGKALGASIANPWFLAFDRTTSSPDSVLYVTCLAGYGILRVLDFSSGSSCLPSSSLLISILLLAASSLLLPLFSLTVIPGRPLFPLSSSYILFSVTPQRV